MTRSAPVAAAVWMALAADAFAQVPVAVVEDVQGSPPGVEMMAYVTAGETIRLGAKDTIVLSYLKSCQRETITAAHITVGTEQSHVQSGTVNREKTVCDIEKMDVAVGRATNRVGGMVFRSGPGIGQRSLLALKPEFFLYGLSPVVELKPGSRVVIERADRPGEVHDLTPRDRKMRGNLYDFADDGKALVRAGVYRAKSGTVEVLFQVDPNAKPGRAPLAGRLLRLQAPN